MNKTLTDAEYFAIPAISKSQLHAWTNDNPMAFWKGCKLNPKCEEVEENDAIANGKLRHTLLLEPEKAESEFAVIEGGKGFSKRDTQAFKNVIADNPGKTVVTKAELETAKLQIDTLKSYKIVHDILLGGSIEKPFLWTDETTGLPLKAKLDLIKRVDVDGTPRIVIVEYKTTTKEMGQIERGLDIMGWHWDVGMQCKAVRERYHEDPFQMIFLVQSQKEGCENCIRPFIIDANALADCARYVDDALAQINKRYQKWKAGEIDAWKTNIQFFNFQGYMDTPFSFKFDKEVANMGA